MYKLNLKLFLSYLPIILLFTAFILVYHHENYDIYAVIKQKIPLTMTFSGTVRPLKVVNVYSPVDSVIASIEVKFGQAVKKGQILFYLTSTSQQNDLRTAINLYLKAKSSLESNNYQNNGNTALYKAGLISKVDYLNSVAENQTNKMSMWDATENLKNTLAKVNSAISIKDLENLTLKDIDKVKAIILGAQKIQIISPIDGILSSQNKVSGADGKELSAGTIVKQNELLATIYEMQGLNFAVNITETQLQEVSVGQKAVITGVAFPSIQLQGYVNSINQEANTDTSATPTYTIRIIVPKITLIERQLIREGMSATITLLKERPPMIRVPLNALIKKDSEYYVKQLNQVNGQVTETVVQPGDTDDTSVEIISGLKEGDVIVTPN